MSWLTGLAGKAEALLDRMDQVAAASLQGATSPKEEPVLVTMPPRAESTSMPTLDRHSGDAQAMRNTPLPGSERHAKEKTSATPRTSSSQRAKQPPNDEALLDFLNSPSTKETVGRRVAQREHTPRQSLQSSAAPPVPAAASPQAKDEAGPGPVYFAAANKETGDSTDGAQLQPTTEAEGVASSQNQENSELRLPSGPGGDESSLRTQPENNQLLQLHQKASNLELENKLLNQEVRSLTSELETQRRHAAEMKDTILHYESEVDSLREEMSRMDHMIRQLRSVEEDTKAELDARNSQIQVLRMRLEEADRTVEKLQTMTNFSDKEKERAVQDAALSNEAHSLALASLRSQLEDTRATLGSNAEAMEALKSEFFQRESRLQSEQKQLSDVVSMQQKQLSQKQAKYAECLASLQSTQNELQLLRREHDDYKQRAAGILLVKERLITSLQSGEGGPQATYEAKLEEMRLGKEHLQAQLQTAHQQLENMKADLRDMEERHTAEVEQLLDQLRVAEESLADEQKLHGLTKSELGRVNMEHDDARAQHIQERTTLSTQLKEKDVELKSLKQKLADLGGSSGRTDLEARLREVTETLIQKQTLLETLGAEKNSMQVQLSRLKLQLSDTQQYRPQQQPPQLAVSGLEGSDAGASVRSISSVIPQNLNRVRKAANTVDRLSIRLGTLLRRYPQFRLFVLLYMLLLHLWVMVVLLTYKPEIHPHDM